MNVPLISIMIIFVYFSVDGQVFRLRLTNGQIISVVLPPPRQAGEDFVRTYGCRVLELGLLFKNWLDAIKLPNRERALRLFKLTMPIFLANNSKSKYAYEIMRLLVHQQCSLSEKEAVEEFYALFVNTKGKMHTHIPVDDRMEWQVGKVKKHLKHMFSNKTEDNILKKTKALGGLAEVAENYDKATNVVVRATSHTEASALGDELTMQGHLREVRPWRGRYFEGFNRMSKSAMQGLDLVKYRNWIQTKLYRFATDLALYETRMLLKQICIKSLMEKV